MNVSRKYQVCITVTQEIDDILHKVGEGNRSKGVRLLAKRQVLQDSKDPRYEMDEIYADLDKDGNQVLLPAPGPG